MAYNTTGAVFRPKDLPAGWKKRARQYIKDLSPDTKDSVLKIIDSWEGRKSEEKLKEILGQDKADRITYSAISSELYFLAISMATFHSIRLLLLKT
jgi:hypothetical protein